MRYLSLVLCVSLAGCIFVDGPNVPAGSEVNNVNNQNSTNNANNVDDMGLDASNNVNNTNNTNNTTNSDMGLDAADLPPDMTEDMAPDMPRMIPIGNICDMDAESIPVGSCDLMAQNDCVMDEMVGVCDVVLLEPPPNPTFGVACVERPDADVFLPPGAQCNTASTTEICRPELECNTLRESPSRCRVMCELATGRGCDPDGPRPNCAEASSAFASVGVGLCADSCDRFQ